MDDRTLALLGDRAAQERITERGELLPCPKCGGDVEEHGPEDWKPTWYDPDSGGDPVNYVCECGLTFCIGSYDYYETMKEWNTRATILTPEQLMKMDGQPIWIEHDEDPKYNHVWMIWNNEIGMRHNLAGYNIFWRAYAYPHAHIDREAWEPCGECEKRNCDNCLYSEYLSSMEPCKSCYNAKKWKPVSRFCGECGRPLTDEAWAELEKRLRG